jgi:hypothetical protein
MHYHGINGTLFLPANWQRLWICVASECHQIPSHWVAHSLFKWTY